MIKSEKLRFFVFFSDPGSKIEKTFKLLFIQFLAKEQNRKNQNTSLKIALKVAVAT